ncbi:MAG: Ferrous iron permease EfeU [Gammaproteobacteria bacterium]|nr:Ferrous iron permease EfeU [Gammaproteobacteria bacterium]
MSSAFFIVWRESLEAVLIVGILYAWIRRNGVAGAAAYLWGGVAGGIVLAAALALAIFSVQSQLGGEALEYFQTAIVALAAALIIQMVFWMRRHGRGLARSLEAGAREATSSGRLLGLAALAAIAVGREGAETVIFLYGLGLERGGTDLAAYLGAAAGGLAAALLTSWAMWQGALLLSWGTFFRVTGFILLLLASALIVTAVERLIGMEALPAGVDPLWDLSGVLDDGAGVGNVVAAFTGWRARPALLTVLVWSCYWLALAAVLRPSRLPARRA